VVVFGWFGGVVFGCGVLWGWVLGFLTRIFCFVWVLRFVGVCGGGGLGWGVGGGGFGFFGWGFGGFFFWGFGLWCFFSTGLVGGGGGVLGVILFWFKLGVGFVWFVFGGFGGWVCYFFVGVGGKGCWSREKRTRTNPMEEGTAGCRRGRQNAKQTRENE